MTTKVAKHTPGPWRAANLDDLCAAEVIGGDGHSVAMIREPYRARPESDANARLIAAAPAMLEALELVRMSLGWRYLSNESKLVIDNAIRAAVGECAGQHHANATTEIEG